MVENKTTKVRVELHASKLKNVAGAFKGTSDPYAVVTLLANNLNEEPRVLGKTEVIKNNLSPKWTTYFDIDYEFGAITRLNVGVYDEVRKGQNKPMGSAMFEVGEVLGTRGNTKAKRLRPGGDIFMRITPVPETEQGAGTLHCTFQGHKLQNVDGFFSKSDPFFEIFEKVDAAGGLTWQPIYRSKPIMNNLNPKWEPFAIDMGRLCGGDRTKIFLVKVWDWQKNGKHASIGSFETNVNSLLDAVVDTPDDTSKGFAITKRMKLVAGYIIVTEARVEGAAPDSLPPPTFSAFTGTEDASAPAPAAQLMSQSMPPSTTTPSFANTAVSAAAVAAAGAAFSSHSHTTSPTARQETQPAWSSLPPSVSSSFLSSPLPPPLAPPKPRPKFVEYLTGGLELELAIAIDFTGSNGDPRQPGTLHYIHPDGKLNDYEKAITAVGSIIGKYDADQKFSVWGFGAKYGGVIQHCFQVGESPELVGLPGVLEAYRTVFRTGLTMSGPTVFAEVIGMAAAEASSKQDSYRRIGKQAYKILLILTDGAVTDVDLTKRALEGASDAPMSVVIVGIGSADFSNMYFLDNFQVNNQGRGRDICKFVEFSKYKDDKRALTRETLAEIPDQLVDYFFSRGIMPLPPISGSQITLDVEEPDDEDIDLTMNFSPEGEISLANNQGAVYDDSKYENMSAYVPHATPATKPYQQQPPTYQQPAAPYQSQVHQYQPTAPTMSASNVYQPSASLPPQSSSSLYQSPHASLPHQPQGYPGHLHSPPASSPAAHVPPFSQSLSTPSPSASSFNHSSPPSASPPGQYQPSPPMPPATQAVPPNPIFHVKAPPGSYPGMQLQVKNPFNGQMLLVTVPPGVPPGGTFGVRY